MNKEIQEFDFTRKNILICDTQPVAVEGMKWLIKNAGDLQFAGSVPTLEGVYHLLNPEAARLAAEAAALVVAECEASVPEPLEMAALVAEMPEGELSANDLSNFVCEPADAEDYLVKTLVGENFESEFPPAFPAIDAASGVNSIIEPIDAVIIDKGLGLVAVMDLLRKLALTSHPTPIVVWGAAISEGEALRLLQAGARGIVRRTSGSDTLLSCLRAVTSGGTWMEDGIFGSAEKLFNPKRSQLTSREREVVVLVEKGMRNRDIATSLGIRTGTVKIHLKHIFEKTGVRGRYGLAFTGLQSKGSIAMTAPPQLTV